MTKNDKKIRQVFYDIIKELKGGFSAYYWNVLSKQFGYDLKNEYRYGADEVMDAVLEDFDINKDFMISEHKTCWSSPPILLLSNTGESMAISCP